MYKFETKHVDSVEKYILAVQDGCLEIDFPKDLKDPIFEALKELKDTDDNILFKYATFLANQRQYDEPNRIFEELSNKGNIAAMNALGLSYLYGTGVEKNFEKGVELLQKASNAGYAIAYYNLGLCYNAGAGLSRSQEDAFKMFLKAAEQGYVYAQEKIAVSYRFGYGVEKSPEKSFKWYLKAAEQGHLESQNQVAIMYKNGTGVEQSYEKSFIWFLKASEKNHPNALNNIGYFYENGLWVSKSLEKAFEYYKRAADQGEVSAIHNVAVCYERGNGVIQDYKKASEYYQIASDKNYISSMINLGLLYETGKGVNQSYEKAVLLYEKAAAFNSAIALCNLATLYKIGKGVAQSYEKAFELYMKSADQGFARAQYNVGCLYYNGQGVIKSFKNAFLWYKKAADQGYTLAMGNVGYAYYSGEGVTQSYQDAVYWFSKGAEKGNKYSIEMLANCYQEGLGVPKDEEKAFYWLKKGAEMKSAYCLNGLGVVYQEGRGVEIDYETAFHYYKLAAEMGSPTALHNIGYCYQEGIGVEQSYERAVEWYQKAIEKNYITSYLNLGIFYELGYGVEQNSKKAVELYQIAADGGNPIAMKNLGVCYEFGRGVEKDINKAIELYKKSAEKGYDWGQIRLACCYRDGIGVEKNLFTAFEWFVQAALKGNKSGQFFTGYFLEKYFKKPEKAVEWYLKAAEQGHGPSLNNLGVLYQHGRGVSQDYNKAAEYYQKSVEQNDPTAMSNLAYFYKNGKGVEQDYEKALALFERAYKLGYVQAKDVIEEIRQILFEKEHEKLKVPRDVDIFISWNHHNLDFKEQLKNELKDNGVEVWDSDENAEGDLNLDVQYAIRHVKGFVVLLSKEALKSGYMPIEVNWMFERIKKDGLNDTIIKVYILGDSGEINDGLNALPEDHAFKKLIPLTMDFSNNDETILAFAHRVIRQNIVINYQERLKETFDVFPISLTDIILQQDNKEVVASLEFENGFINRDLFDKDGNKYAPKDLLNLKDITFIHGEGGSGKSLYIKNLIRNNSNLNNMFFYLPCGTLAKEIKNGDSDLISLIAKLSFKIADYHEIPLSFVNDIFRNEKKNFYIVFDGLDEGEDEKDAIIQMVDSFNALKTDKHISFIFTSRNNGDGEKISSLTNKKVVSLVLNKMSDEDIIKLFDAIYERNKYFESEENRVSRPAFIHYLSIIADDIKKNPLLISNLIYIYFATKELQAQKAYILEKTNNLIINSLESERGTDVIRKEITDQFDIDLGRLLEFVAFKVTCNEDYTLEESISDYFKENGLDTPPQKTIRDLCKYLRSRRIIVGNRFSHNIYLSYFAAKYIYRKIYKNKSDDFGDTFITFTNGGEDKLKGYISKRFSLEDGLWPSITVDLIAKLDFEIHYIKAAFESLDNNNPTYKVFAFTLTNMASGISDIAKKLIVEISSKDNILYYAKLINEYFK